MDFIKKILGFNSTYSWTKWVRISAFAVAAVFVLIFVVVFAPFGLMRIVLFFIFIFPISIVCIVIATAIGAIIGAVRSKRKQTRSLKESAASGSAEILELDKMRVKVQKSNFSFFFIIGLFVIINTVASLLYFFRGEDIPALPALAVLIIEVIIVLKVGSVNSPIKKYEKLFKEQIVEKGLESVLSDMDFKPAKTIDEEVVRSSKLFDSYGIFSGNDYLSAEYKGKRFKQSDIHLQSHQIERYRDNNGNWHTRTIYRTIFKGRFMVFDYDAISDEPVYVYDKQMRRFDENKIETELDAFNNRFSIKAADATTAFRILTPPVLEGILLAAGKLKYPVSLAFLNDKLYVALSNGDSFEAQSYGDITLSEQREQVREEIQTILDMAENLYLEK